MVRKRKKKKSGHVDGYPEHGSKNRDCENIVDLFILPIYYLYDFGINHIMKHVFSHLYNIILNLLPSLLGESFEVTNMKNTFKIIKY